MRTRTMWFRRTGHPMHVGNNVHSGMDWKVALGLGLLGFALSGVLGYFHEDVTVGTSLATIQAHQKDTAERVDRIENKLDRLILMETGAQPNPNPAQH